eukprot:scpid97892/ scgid8142/ 
MQWDLFRLDPDHQAQREHTSNVIGRGVGSLALSKWKSNHIVLARALVESGEKRVARREQIASDDLWRQVALGRSHEVEVLLQPDSRSSTDSPRRALGEWPDERKHTHTLQCRVRETRLSPTEPPSEACVHVGMK